MLVCAVDSIVLWLPFAAVTNSEEMRTSAEIESAEVTARMGDPQNDRTYVPWDQRAKRLESMLGYR